MRRVRTRELWDITHTPLDHVGMAHNIAAKDTDATRSRLEQAEQLTDKSSFARPVRSNHSDDLPFMNREI